MTIGDTITVVIFLFVFSVTVILAAVFLNAFSVVFTGTAGEAALTSTVGTINSVNNWFPYVLIGLFISVLVSAYFIDTHPLYLVFSLVIMVLGIIAAGAFVDMFNEFAGHTGVSGVINNFTGVVGLWQNMPTFVLFMGIGVLIVLYAKHRRGGAGAPIQ